MKDIISHISFVAQQTQNPAQTELQMFASIAPQLAIVKGDQTTRLQDRQLDIAQEDNRMGHTVDLVEAESKERIEDGKLEGDIQQRDLNERTELFKATTGAANRKPNN